MKPGDMVRFMREDRQDRRTGYIFPRGHQWGEVLSHLGYRAYHVLWQNGELGVISPDDCRITDIAPDPAQATH